MSDKVPRIKGGAVMDERSPLNEAMDLMKDVSCGAIEVYKRYQREGLTATEGLGDNA